MCRVDFNGLNGPKATTKTHKRTHWWWLNILFFNGWLKNDELMIPQMRWWVDSCFVGEPCFLIFNIVFVLFWSYIWFLVVSRPPSLRRCFYNSWQDIWRAPRILGASWWRAGYGLTTPLQLRWNPTIEASWFFLLSAGWLKVQLAFRQSFGDWISM